MAETETAREDWRCGACGKYHMFQAAACSRCGTVNPAQQPKHENMNAQKIVNALLEDDAEKKDEKPKKKMPSWLAKIKGEDTGDGDGDGEKKADGHEVPNGGSSKDTKGIGTPSSAETVKKTW